MLTGLICFGDSILAGTGASSRDLCCAKRIKSSLDHPVSLKGRNWDTSADGLIRLEIDVLSQTNLSHVLILFGNNDSWFTAPNKPAVSVMEIKNNLKQLINKIMANQQIPILCNLQPLNAIRTLTLNPNIADYYQRHRSPDDVQMEYSRAIDVLSNEVNCFKIDIRSALDEKGQSVMAEDGLHPNDEGHKIIAATVLNFLKTIEPDLRLTPYGRELIQRQRT